MRISTAAIAVKRARIRYSRLKKVFAPWRIYPPISAIRALDEAGISPMSTAMQQHQEKEAISISQQSELFGSNLNHLQTSLVNLDSFTSKQQLHKT